MKDLLQIIAIVGLMAGGVFRCSDAAAAGKPAIDPNFVVFGYIQSETILPHVRWNALTHVSGTFTGFNSTGTLTSNISGRHAILKAGGAAQAAGVKYIMVVQSFDDSSGGVIEDVMTDYTANGPKQTLINGIVSQVTADGYCGGVNFDLEFSWGSAVRDGIADMLTKLRAALPSQYQLSVYTNAIYSSAQWNAPNLATNCDFVMMSGYDWATGNTAHAITDHNNNTPQINNWINAGIPAEKFVYTISAYGRRWDGISAYNAVGSNASSRGFTDGLYDTTLRAANAGPYTNNYVTGDEGAWYTYNNGTQRTVTWDNLDSLEYKIRAMRSLGTGTNAGKRLGGVAFWSLMWMSDMNREAGGLSFQSRDPITGVTGSSDTATYAYTRTYPHVYQLTQEILSPPGTARQVFNKFEGLDYRWDAFSGTGSTPSPDNLNFSTASTRQIIATPSGTGAPPDSTNCMRLVFTFTAAPGKCFFRHELLNSEIDNSVTDIHAANAKFTANNAVSAYVRSAIAYTGVTVRLVVFDANRQLEASPAFPLNTSGWQQFTWDMTDTALGNINGLVTLEPAFTSGNGVINTAGAGANDIGFVGFLVETTAGGALTGTLHFDELAHETRTPGGAAYTINEFRYMTAAEEFVEITGPAGAFPANLQLRIYDAATSIVTTTVNLGGQTMPASGRFVVGDTSVANVNYIPGGWGSSNNIPNNLAGGIQILDSVSGAVYDSVTYRAMAGLGELVRRQTLGITSEGYGWLGDTGSATTNHTFGRYPDGADTNINEDDFTLMPATPGAANGGAINAATGATFDFTTAPPASVAFQTYQSFSAQAPAVGMNTVGTSGNVLRVIDTSGGGTQAYFGDAALGGAAGYNVTGLLYIPPTTDPAQSIGIGISGRQGSTFFSSSNSATTGYESGYWLVYENGSTGLNDGQPNHAGAFQFLLAKNDNMLSTRTLALGANQTLANVGITLPPIGIWVPFRLSINPSAPDVNGRLLAQINGVDVYRGAIPTGGPTSGAFQVGFRDPAGTAITNARMGTWLEDLTINNSAVPVTLTDISAE
ncbi:MAG: glycoside hydrolase family 18 protein [Candidatus Sumerlaeaceae bacterium]